MSKSEEENWADEKARSLKFEVGKL